MNEAKCHFCGASFRNRQAVRAHLRHCPAYRGRQVKTGSRQGRLPVRSVPIGRPVPQADPADAGFAPVDRVQEATSQPPDHGMAELRALLEAGEKRRQAEAAEAKHQQRRQVIQRVKERVVGQWRSLQHSIPAATTAQALTDIERELKARAVDELPEWELVQTAEGIRDTLYGPVIRAQDRAQRQEEQRRREAQEEAQRAVEQRAKEDRERQHAQDRTFALVQHGTGFADDALQDVEGLPEHERQRRRPWPDRSRTSARRRDRPRAAPG